MFWVLVAIFVVACISAMSGSAPRCPRTERHKRGL